MNICKRGLLASGLSLIFSAAPVFAGDMGEIAPELWAGTYFGIESGAGAGSIHQTFHSFNQTITSTPTPEVLTVVNDTITSSGTLEGRTRGFLNSLFLGYNFHPLSSLIIGGQVEGSLYSNIFLKAVGATPGTETTITTVNGEPSTGILQFNQSNEFDDELRYAFNFVGRVGYLVRLDTMVYALGGVSEGLFVLPFSTNLSTPRSLWTTGGLVGGGAEFKVTEHFSVLAEYRYMSFRYTRSSNDFLTEATPTPATSTTVSQTLTTSLHNRFNFNMGQFGIVYRI